MSRNAGYRRDASGRIETSGGSVSRPRARASEVPEKRGGAVKALVIFAVILLAVAGGMYGYDFYESYSAGKNSEQALAVLNEAMASGADIDDYLGIIEIPAIEVTLPVFNSWDYGKLKTAPCVYGGDIENNSAIIIGHDYKAHFADLPQLKYGDEVSVKTVDGTLYKYKVKEITEIDGSDIAGMYSGNWDLTLYTCNSTGAKRITVRCDRTLW